MLTGISTEYEMLSWLSQNLATILITLLLVAIVAAIIIGMVRRSKKIKSTNLS